MHPVPDVWTLSVRSISFLVPRAHKQVRMVVFYLAEQCGQRVPSVLLVWMNAYTFLGQIYACTSFNLGFCEYSC